VIENREVERNAGVKEPLEKIVLDRKAISSYLAVTSVVRPVCWVLTERERADMEHDDKSQVGTMPGRTIVAICLFARL
jgi:hypothetical protein